MCSNSPKLIFFRFFLPHPVSRLCPVGLRQRYRSHSHPYCPNSNNFKVFLPRKQSFVKASYLFNAVKIGQYQHYQYIVKPGGELCYLSATRSSVQGKTELLLPVSFNKPDEALTYYKERWQIETLFKGMKSSGFNIEDTHVTALDRLEKLMMLTMVAYIWCYLIGDYIDREIKPIRIKKNGRKAKSVFKYGLDYLSETLLSGCKKLNFCIIQILSCT